MGQYDMKECNCANDYSDCKCVLVNQYRDENVRMRIELGEALREIYTMRDEDKLISTIFNSQKVQQWIDD
jgi:hypothetical protein